MPVLSEPSARRRSLQEFLMDAHSGRVVHKVQLARSGRGGRGRRPSPGRALGEMRRGYRQLRYRVLRHFREPSWAFRIHPKDFRWRPIELIDGLLCRLLPGQQRRGSTQAVATERISARGREVRQRAAEAYLLSERRWPDDFSVESVRKTAHVCRFQPVIDAADQICASCALPTTTRALQRRRLS